MEPSAGTKQRLLEAAIAVIDEEGVKGIRIRDIAAAAGVREPSVYHFFGSRDGLVEAALAERFNIHLSEMFQSFNSGLVDCRTQADFVELVRSVLAKTFEDGRSRVRSIRADIIGSAQSRPQLKEAVNEAMLGSFTDFNRYVEAAQIRGWIDPALDGVTFAAWITGVLNGRVYIEMNPDAYNFPAWQKMTTDAALLLLGYVDDKPIWTQTS